MPVSKDFEIFMKLRVHASEPVRTTVVDTETGYLLTWWGIMLDVVDTPYRGGA